MRKEANKRLRKVGIKIKDKLKLKSKRQEGIEESDKDFELRENRGDKLLPTDYLIREIRRKDEEYQVLKREHFKKALMADKLEFSDFVRRLIDDGRDVALFAYRVLRCDDGVVDDMEITVKERIWACEYLTDRAFGKATNRVEVLSTTRHITDEELIREIELLREKLGEKVIDGQCRVTETKRLATGEAPAGTNKED